VWVVATDPEPGDVPASWWSLLDADETDEAARRKRPRDRARYVARHVVLRTVLGRQLGIDPAAVSFARATCPLCAELHGRPVLLGRDDVAFSLSSTDGLIAVAVAPVDVGVDVETVGRVAADDLASALDSSERAAVDALSEPDRSAAALRCWVRKEALLKGRGTGLGVDPDTVHVGIGPLAETPRADGWMLADVPVQPGVVAAVAYRPPVAKVEVLTLDLPALRHDAPGR